MVEVELRKAPSCRDEAGMSPQRMRHLPFSTQGLFFISSGFRKGSSGIPSSIHFTNLQRGEGGWAQPRGEVRAAKLGIWGAQGHSCSAGGIPELLGAHGGVPSSATKQEGNKAICNLKKFEFWKREICIMGVSQGSGGPMGATRSWQHQRLGSWKGLMDTGRGFWP